jgi:hypothetical protein
VRRAADRRACFALTNRRLLIHPGVGAQMNFGGSGGTQARVVVRRGPAEVIAYTGFELTRMQRVEEKRFPGCGSLVFNRNVLDEPAGGHLWALADLHKVERMVREKLVHPIMDKLLRGERLSAEDKTKQQEAAGGQEEAEVLAPDENIKDFLGGKSAGEDANVKDVRAGAGLDQLDDESREKVEAELTEGERVLWAGVPEGKTQGRGLLGNMVGSEERREPDYSLYALTNRRVLLWFSRGTHVGKGTPIRFGKGPNRAPVSYYPPHLLQAGLEQDKRIHRGGSIVFRRVRVVITTTTEFKNRRGPNTTRTSTRKELHHFGLLRIRDYLAVARMLYDTLIGPCRGL